MPSSRSSQLHCSHKRILATQPVRPLGALIALVFAVGSILGLAACAGYTSLGSNAAGVVTITTNSVPNGAIGTAYSTTLTASGGTDPYSWSIGSGSLPSGVSLSSSGTISGTPASSGSYSFTAVASDSQGKSGRKALNFGVLGIMTTSLPNGTSGSSYSSTLQATGGATPYTWSVSSGSLPAGLNLNSSSGTISGTPSAAGNFSFTAKVTDSGNMTASQALSLSVSSPGSPNVTTSSLPGGTAGTSYSATLQASGGKTPYTWSISSGSLPAGLNLSSSSGAISGTPTASGTSTFTAQVQDANNNTGSKQLSISIVAAGPQPLTITSTAMPQASTNNAYSQSLTATGGTAPYSWSISSGSLPPGLSLTASSGLIGGQATSTGSYNFTAKVTDSATPANTATQALSITVVTGVALDQYGGRTDIKCANATGWFHAEEINKRWWLCTPLGNAFYAQVIEEAPEYIHGARDMANVNRRIESWGFNTIGNYSYYYDYPFVQDSSFNTPDGTNPVKMPFMMIVRPGYGAMNNPPYGPGNTTYLTEPAKNMLNVITPQFVHLPGSYIAPGGVVDYYDSRIGTWLTASLNSTSDIWLTLASSPYENYLIGIAADDGDEMQGMEVGPDFPTNPVGYNNYNLTMQVASMSPLETATSQWLYTDTLMHSKMAWRNYLAAKYSTISALNTAWGSNYTTFDSSGTCVGSQPITCASNAAADQVGTGNGTRTSFSFTLTHTPVSQFSLQILVGGTPVAGDATGIWNSGQTTGTISGPNVSGTINYSTGALTLSFASGQAPASGSAITATYVANGWEYGTGVLDEDDRPTHLWMGTDWVAGSTANPNTWADFNAFLEQMATQYFSTCRTGIKAMFPNIMYLGPDSFDDYNAPTSAPVLKGAAPYIDAFITANNIAMTQPMLDYIETNFGNKPFFGSFYSMADPDSPFASNPNDAGLGPGAFLTQPARGAGYYSMQQAQLTTAHTTAGDFPYIGTIWFDYADLSGEQHDWGLTTPSDNAYDGHEAVAGSVACSAPISQYTCGGESKNYGNLIGGPQGVAAANALWLTIP